jgi:hypothetical protein
MGVSPVSSFGAAIQSVVQTANVVLVSLTG